MKEPFAYDILNMADDMIRNRGIQYGHPAINHMRISQFWSAFLDYPVKPEQVAMMMALVKISRLVETPSHLDSYVDLSAYTAIAGQLANMDWEQFNAYPKE